MLRVFQRWVFLPKTSALSVVFYATRRALRKAEELRVYALGGLRGPRRGGVKFLLVGDGRMGSELLIDLLGSHPRVRCDGEVLDLPIARPARYVECRARLARRPVYGWKLLTYQLERIHARLGAETFLADLAAAGWRIIHLKRRNLFRQAVSAMVAVQRRQWHSKRGDEPLPGRLALDADQLLARLDALRQRAAVEASALHGLRRLNLTYEDDLMRPELHQATAEKVFSFLDLEPAPVASAYVRITPRRTADFISNYDQIVETLRGTEFERWLMAD
jgi:hypothetical protein